ncbi:MAG: DEAD/DEAH box helicase, partial [Ornithinimicrobium sp.]
MSTSSFAALGVPAPLVAVLTHRGITEPTPIQQATLPDSMSGRDVLGRGRTGSGKTYAFALPLVARLAASGTPR